MGIPDDPKTADEIDVSDKQIGDEGGAKIGEMLASNSAITSLDLRNNKVSDETAGAFAKSLEVNETLKTLYLKDNGITNDGAQKFVSLLEKKSAFVLKQLDLECNTIEGEMVDKFKARVEALGGKPEVNTGYQKVGFRSTGYKKDGTSAEVVDTSQGKI